jgi:pimeloyl-ACP methyl ester carboxylesterase
MLKSTGLFSFQLKGIRGQFAPEKRLKELPMPFKTVNDFNIYYEVHGEGEAIIFLHHGFGCTKIWNRSYPSFVAEGYKIVMYDRRGYGRSEGGDDFFEFYESDRYRPESVDELRLIKEILGIGPCHLVGQCEGGVVGIDYAVKYPEDVKTLTVASTQCYSEIPMTELNMIRLINLFSQLEPELQAKMIEWHGGSAEVKYNQFAKQGGAYGIDYFDLRPILPTVVCPTLIIYPDRSSIFDVEQSVAFYRHLPKGELAVFPRCGHNTYEQRPEDYVHTILEFFKRAREGKKTSKPAVSCLA